MTADLLSNLPARIHGILDEGAGAGSSRTAFTDEYGVEWSYRQVIDVVGQVADELAALGIRPGDRMMIVGENSIAAVVLMYAASRLDAWVVMTSARLTERELASIEQDSSPRCIFYIHATSQEAEVHATRRSTDERILAGIGAVRVSALNTEAVPEPVYEDPARQVAVLIYTTGTTGRPKGVMLSHRSLAYVASRGKRTATILSDDVTLCLMPISHSYGLALMQGFLFAGAHQRIMPRFSMAQALELIGNQTLTVFAAVPSLFARMVAHVGRTGVRLTPNRLRYAYSGTAPLDLALRQDVEQMLGVVLHNGYGLTETSPTISRTIYVKGTGEINIGTPIPGVEIKIVDSDGRQVRDGSPGELLVRGPNVMLGYYRNPEQTRAVLDADGFLRTGDIVSQNSAGALIVQGRAKELIIRSGFNVYPPEIEAVLNGHPMVLNSAVVGRAVTGDEEIVAFVESVPDGRIETSELFDLIEVHLAKYKRPHQIVVLDQLPVAPNGKIRKDELKKLAAAGVDIAASTQQGDRSG